jgi:pimeloyl-ACP methyl ester carboxylesterase
VIVCGWSLGAALSLATAARHPGEVQGVAVLSPWTSLADVARHHFPPILVRALLRETYDSLAAARQVTVPALVIHGEEDDLIPAEQGRRIADALAGPADRIRWVPVPGAGHNDLLAQPMVWEELARFFSSFG